MARANPRKWERAKKDAVAGKQYSSQPKKRK